MRNHSRRAAWRAVLAACALAAPVMAGAQAVDLDAATQAKIAKEKAKARGMEQAKGTAGAADKTVVTGKDGDCSINVGNVDASKSGPGKMAPRENTVVITGPVINLGKCK